MRCIFLRKDGSGCELNVRLRLHYVLMDRVRLLGINGEWALFGFMSSHSYTDSGVSHARLKPARLGS